MVDWIKDSFPRSAEFTVVRTLAMKIRSLTIRVRKEKHERHLAVDVIAGNLSYPLDKQYLMDLIWYRRMPGIEWMTVVGSGSAIVTAIVLEVYREHSLHELLHLAELMKFRIGPIEQNSIQCFKERA